MTENHPCTSPWMKGPWHDSPIARKSSKAGIASYFFRKTMQEMQKIILGEFLQTFIFSRGEGVGASSFPSFQLIPSLFESPLFFQLPVVK